VEGNKTRPFAIYIYILHTYMCISNIRKEYFIILLWKNSLAGSSLQVMGQHESSGQWSIMGGTGQFTMARGVIEYKTIQQDDSSSRTFEVCIYAYYTPMNGWKAGLVSASHRCMIVISFQNNKKIYTHACSSLNVSRKNSCMTMITLSYKICAGFR
jgi:hypothetical protein